MLSHSLKHALSGGCLITSVIAAGAQEVSNRPTFANLPSALATTDGSSAARGRHTVAPDIRALLADPAIRNFIGLTENAYDFTDPHGVPGFGPMPPSSEKQTVEQ
jgi:hypothetical protein